MRLLACALLAVIAAPQEPLQVAQSRLARGDALGASRALEGIACPAIDQGAARAAWLDARGRIAWQQGRTDQAFALCMQAVACAERAGITLPAHHAALQPDQTWIDAASGLPPRVLPTGESGEGASLAKSLAESPEAQEEAGAWLRLAARLLDPSRPAVEVAMPAENAKVARRRVAFLQAALAARAGDAEASVAAVRASARDAAALQPLCQWFEGEALLRRARPDPRTASLRFVQCAATLDAAPWLRASALRRAAAALETIDPSEASRLRAAADEETP
ncbi:MAG: hypothetical protein ACOYMI_07050 [Phycisphaerales bacterium]|jgi:hypothetical protein